MFRIHITRNKQELGMEPTYAVAVYLPGQSAAPTATIGEHNLQVILYELLLTKKAVDDVLAQTPSKDRSLIELHKLSEQHFNMLRGLPPSAVGR